MKQHVLNDEIPKSRLTMTYHTKVEGERSKEVNLPMRFLLMGDLSQGTSVDRGEELDSRQIRVLDGSNLNSVIKDMGMVIKLEAENRVDPDKAGTLDVEIPVESMKSFDPLQVANAVPKLKSLLLMKKLLLEAQAALGNRKAFRGLVQALTTNPEAAEALRQSLSGHQGFKVPELATPAPEGSDGSGGDADS